MKLRILHIRRVLILAVCALCATMSASAQVQVAQKIDSLSILIGEQTDLHLTVRLKDGQKAQLPSFKPSQMITPGVEVVSWKDGDTTDIDHSMKQIERIYTLTSFDEKVYAIPALDVKVGGRNYHGNELALKVLTVAVDTVHPNQFYPPKDVQDNPFLWSEWSTLFWWSILMLLLIAAVIFLVVRLRQNKPIRMSFRIVKKIPAHEKALKEIDEIKHEHVEGQEAQKKYYTQLTDTLREYIESRFGFRAMEMTSDQIIEKLRQTGDQKMIDELRELFQTADLVKFAKYETLINENDYNLVNAVKFIDETKTDEEETEERVAPALSEEDKKQNSQRKWLKALTVCIAVIAALLLVYVIYQAVMLLI